GPSEGATRTLLVEDHDLLRPMLTEVLTGFGHEVTACSGVGEALASDPVVSGGLDLLVVDVNLQDGSGLDLVRTIGERTAHQLPTIFITGNPTSLGEQALGPATKVLHKPFGITDLQQEIDLVLAEYQSSADLRPPYPIS
ncbi:MAG: response regulator, partial [Planctomycetota bacterium]|nr:response regulator [Planctomycetota bacterium]